MSYSSRVLQKLQGREKIFSPTFSDDDVGDENEHEEKEVEEDVKTLSNKFLLLNVSEEEVACETTDDDNNIDAEANAKHNSVPINNQAKDSKSKKRKRKKKFQKNTNKEESHEKKTDIEDDLSEFNDIAHSSTSVPNLKNNKPRKSIMSIEHRHLNPDNELRKIFGSRVLMGDPTYRRRAKGPSYKGVWLSQPQNNWPNLRKLGLSMQQVEEKNGVQVFKFVHNKDYQEIQMQFLDAVDSSDHRHLVAILDKHHFHVDTLLTFSDICKLQEDLKMSREVLERCLYCLECSFHSCFNITTGKSILPYKYQENRCLFLALFKHMCFVSQRGCNRTALELCKVLLSLDPEEDPLCSVFFFDYFAMRASKHEFIVQFSEAIGNKRNLWQLPNWAYSKALAQYHLAQSDGSLSNQADLALQDALIMFPSVLLLLLEKCSVRPDDVVSTHPFFTTQARESSPRGLDLLTHLFVERNHTMWKDPAVLAWLERNVKIVLETLDEKKSFVNDCARKRKTRYQKPPLNVYRHALISELPGLSSLLPMEIRTGDLLSHDPLPPSDSVSSYQRRTRRRISSNRPRNPVSLFFRSLLPGFDPDDPLQVGIEEQGEGPDAGQLRGNAQVLMDAMRELLGNFQQPFHESDQEDFAQDWD